jgi:hypothetical protein
MSTARRENSNVPVSSGHRLTVAVLVPCLNEAAATPKVIADFRRYLHLSVPVRFTSVKSIDP